VGIGDSEPLLLVTFSGERGKSVAHPVNNVWWGISRTGRATEKMIATKGPRDALDELRGMTVDSEGALFVAVARKSKSHVSKFVRHAEGSYHFVEQHADSDTTRGIQHPYGLALDDAGHLYIASQDTAVVSQIVDRGAPGPVAAWWQKHYGDGFYPGTWAPAARGTGVEPLPPAKRDSHGKHESPDHKKKQGNGREGPPLVEPRDRGLIAPRARQLIGDLPDEPEQLAVVRGAEP
jgi:hypothetical protein